MRIAYINGASGIAGDMMVASFVDSGLPAKRLETFLRRSLPVKDWKLEFPKVERGHHAARQMLVKGDMSFHSPRKMKLVFKKSSLPPKVKQRSIAVLDALVAAESAVHGMPTDKVHFHELNSIDTIIDIGGVCAALHLLKIDRLCSSAINVGRPAPATLELLKVKQLPVFSTHVQFESATPTGIAIVSTIAESFGSMPAMAVCQSGFGAGTKVIPGESNMLQLVIGEQPGVAASYDQDTVVHLETNIDDMDPRVYPYIIEKLLFAGANDAWMSQVIMKKGRPGVVLSVLCSQKKEQEMAGILFEETTTLGIRRTKNERYMLPRIVKDGRKIAVLTGGRKRIRAEYEVAKQEALKKKKPLLDLSMFWP
jgi:uncharacterized protein (TIGR00299 family) protein